MLVLSALAAASLAACGRGGEGAVAVLKVESGTAEIRRGSSSREARGEVEVRPGDQLALESGSAVLTFGEGRQVELRDGSTVSLGRAGSGREAELVSGDALVLAGQGRAVRLEASGTHLAVLGEARVTRRLAVLVAVYAGQAEVQSAGRELRVPALRQVSVPAAGLLPSAPEPFTYSASDPWDQRLLGGAIDLGGQLTARSRGFTAQLPDGAGTPALFGRLFPELGGRDPELVLRDATSRAPGETLVGTAIALQGTGGDLARRADAVFALRDAGADWGLIALEHGVQRVPLLESIDAAIRRAPTRFGSPGSGVTPTAEAPGAGATGATRPTGGSARGPSTAQPGTPGPGAAAPGPGVPPGPAGGASAGGGPPGGAGDGEDEVGTLNTGIDAVDNVVNDLVETLSGILRSLGPG